jgi:hypothetical protein
MTKEIVAGEETAASGCVEELDLRSSSGIALLKHNATGLVHAPTVALMRHRQAQALVIWVQMFHLPSLYLRRKKKQQSNKNEAERILVTNPAPGILHLHGSDELASSSFTQVWKKSISAALKKVTCEDLGPMDAIELLATIPETDPEGRGMQDFCTTEKKLSVKVVFDQETGHVFLVGDSKKLEKKCFVLRNMLSHYHWRLSGREVSFSK